MTYSLTYVSDKSPNHIKNQDSLGVWQRENVLFAALADGMGGLSKGELASNTVVSDLKEWFYQIDLNFNFSDKEIADSLTKAVMTINHKVKQYGTDNNINLGSTLVCVLIKNQDLLIFNIGDSRAYLISDELKQISEEQTVAYRDLKMGRITPERLHDHPQLHVLLQAIGTNENLLPHIEYYSLENEVILLASDGFTNKIEDSEILKWTETKDSLLESISKLRDKGEVDDISALVIRSG